MRKGQVWPSDKNAGKTAPEERRTDEVPEPLARRDAGQDAGAPALDALFTDLSRWWSASLPAAQQAPEAGKLTAPAVEVRAARLPNLDGIDRVLEELGRRGQPNPAAGPPSEGEVGEPPLAPVAGALPPAEEETRREGGVVEALPSAGWRSYAVLLAFALGPLAFHRLRPARRSTPQLRGG